MLPVQLLHPQQKCAYQGANLGTRFSTVDECISAADKHASCGDTAMFGVMWSSQFNEAWGCRCCRAGGPADTERALAMSNPAVGEAHRSWDVWVATSPSVN